MPLIDPGKLSLASAGWRIDNTFLIWGSSSKNCHSIDFLGNAVKIEILRFKHLSDKQKIVGSNPISPALLVDLFLYL